MHTIAKEYGKIKHAQFGLDAHTPALKVTYRRLKHLLNDSNEEALVDLANA